MYFAYVLDYPTTEEVYLYISPLVRDPFLQFRCQSPTGGSYTTYGVAPYPKPGDVRCNRKKIRVGFVTVRRGNPTTSFIQRRRGYIYI
jgi:hypothetical protein